MKKILTSALLLLVLTFASVACMAQVTAVHQTAVGVWETPNGGHMEFYVQDAKLYAKVVNPDKGIDPNSNCTKCSGDLKDKPIKGAVLIYNFTPDPDGTWVGGRIVDSKSGMTYQGKIKVEGTTMTLRAYLGNPILGGTIVWKKVQ